MKLIEILEAVAVAAKELDDHILDKLESLCHKQQKWSGISHYKWLILIAIANSALFLAIASSESNRDDKIYAGSLAGLLFLLAPLLNWWEQKSLKRMVKGFRNPLRRNINALLLRYYCYMTMSFLLAAMLRVMLFEPQSMWGMTIFAAWWTTIAALLTLPACDPLPPAGGKWKEWLTQKFLRSAEA